MSLALVINKFVFVILLLYIIKINKNLQQWRIIDERKTRSAGNRSCIIQADI